MSTFFSQLDKLVKGFNWHSPSWDLFVLLAWLGGSAVYAFTAGRGRIINILLSCYVAKLLVAEAPFLSGAIARRLPESLVSFQQLAVFGVLFFLLFALLGRYGFRTSADGRQLGSLVFGLLFSVLQVGLLISIVLSYLPLSVQGSLSPLVSFLFVAGQAPFIWLVLPLVFLILLGKHVADPNEF